MPDNSATRDHDCCRYTASVRRPVRSTNTARARSVKWNAIGGIGSIAVNLITFPLALTAAGPDHYGAWLICVASLTLFLQADLGLASALIRDLSRTSDPAHSPEARLRERSGLSLFRTLSLIYPAGLIAVLVGYFALLDHGISTGYIVLCLCASGVVLAISLIGRFYT